MIESDPTASDVPSASNSEPRGSLSFWFGLSHEVSRRDYALCGFGLMTVKYLVEAAAIWNFAGRVFTPLDFLNPLLSVRQTFFQPPAPNWLQFAVLFWTLPFLWISVSMSVRRAINSGMTAATGLAVLLPGVNYILMLVLCLMPSVEVARLEDVWLDEKPRPPSLVGSRVGSALLGVLIGLLIAMAMVGLSVYVLQSYGASLFFATPVTVSAAAAYIHNRNHPRGLSESIMVAQLAIALVGAALLLFAFEGVICLAMLYPLAAAMGVLGGLIGYACSTLGGMRITTLLLIVGLLPCLAGAESLYRSTPLFEVASAIEIDAPPEQVWPHVIGFSELPPPPDWYFRLGIAYPTRATIEGRGVGAIRHCEFSTGAFVEPITVWDEPRRLAFDVERQPPPMHELSPYRHVHPPHLDGYLRCRRGEFRLIPLPGNRTRLEGSTWYEFDMSPRDYWTLWSDASIHRIHLRVLNHIRNLAEQPKRGIGRDH